jgi:hypothetical protein
MGNTSTWKICKTKWGQTYLSIPGWIVLDKKCSLFQNLIGDKFADIEWNDSKKRWFNKHTNSYPIVFQGNGSSWDLLFKEVGPKFMI